ncbi:hypothetical protein [Methylobacterium nigriterrae]|uniref:hypothetical protein n=1 Tax=Methylobacterium nigriterrae TaxID=3127512 RepID=UPI0030134F3B
MRRLNYDEPVTVVWHDVRGLQRLAQGKPVRCKLDRAVRLIVSDWERRRDARLGLILRDGGKKPITSYEDVRAIYDRDDFPVTKRG